VQQLLMFFMAVDEVMYLDHCLRVALPLIWFKVELGIVRLKSPVTALSAR